MYIQNPSLQKLKPIKDEVILNDFLDTADSYTKSLVGYCVRKQISKSMHVFEIQSRSLKLYVMGLEALGLVENNSDLRKLKSYELKKELLKILREHRFEKNIILAIERLPEDGFDTKYNSDENAWMDRWEKECSVLTIAIYFIRDAVEFARTEKLENLNLMATHYSTLRESD